MTRLRAVLALSAVLMLVGCASAPEAAPTPSSAVEMSLADVVTVDDAVEFGRSLSGSTPDLAGKMTNLAQLIPDLIVDSDIFPLDANSINIDTMTLNSDLIADPADAAAHLGELNSILDAIESARRA